MYRTKEARYAPYSSELQRENVKYQPLVWSAFGRPHPETSAVLTRLAKKGPRRQGQLSSQQLLKRANARIGLEIWRRAARMVMACLPRLQEDEEAEQGGSDTQHTLGKSEPPGTVLAAAATTSTASG
jgi:hypothetical protein